MAFEQKTWVNVPVGETAPVDAPTICAENFNRIEQGIADAHQDNSDTNERITQEVETLNTTISEGDDYIKTNYLPKSGGTMIGDLSLSNSPTQDSHATTKQYVDNSIKMYTISTTCTNNIDVCIGTIPNYNSEKQLVLVYGEMKSKYSERIGSWMIIDGTKKDFVMGLTDGDNAEICINNNGDIIYNYDRSGAASGSYTVNVYFNIMVIPCQRLNI